MTSTSSAASVRIRASVAAATEVVVLSSVFTTVPAIAEDKAPAPTASAAPQGAVPGSGQTPDPTPMSKAVKTPKIESWTPSSHSVTADGKTSLDLYAQPAFKRDADGWAEVDATITKGTGNVAFEALGLVNPVHFGKTADALVTMDTVDGSLVFGLDGATITAPKLKDGVVTYRDVFPGVDLEFRTDDGILSKHLVLADSSAKSTFRFTIADSDHQLGLPVEGTNESWEFPGAVAFGTAIALPAPSAWSSTDNGGLPGSAHQQVTTTATGYAIDLSVDTLWADGATFPVVLDPAIVWTDETWTWGDGLVAGFAPAGATDCEGGPCLLANPVEGHMWVGTGDFDSSGVKTYVGYVGADLHALAGRAVSSAVLEQFDYSELATSVAVAQVCATIGPENTGADVDGNRCGAYVDTDIAYGPFQGLTWSSDQTEPVRDAVDGTGPTPYTVGFAIGSENDGEPGAPMNLQPPGLHLVYEGYPVPRPLTTEQTFGCACWAGTSSTNQAMAADPVNTATGALMEHFSDASIAGVGQSIDLSRTYNSLDVTSGAFGPGWSFAYGATLKENSAGEYVFTDGSGTQTRFGALVGGGYAPIDPAVSATLTDGEDGTRVVRSLSGDTMTFIAAGALIGVADERGQGLTLGYTGTALTSVTDSLGQSLAFTWDGGAGAKARIKSATTSDGRTVTYAYTTTAGAKRLTSVKDVMGKATKYAYAQPVGCR